MSSKLSTNNSTVVAAFHTALLHKGLFALGILAVVLFSWTLLRAAQLRATAETAPSLEPEVAPAPEPVARKLIRLSFGLLWVFDGLLQAQPSMPLGLIPQVVQPTARQSPVWVQHLVNLGATIWSDHPITAAAAMVCIQVGIGLFLIVAPRGLWSRLGGGASVAWGLLVWIFGESFGGIFAGGSSWLFGTPGAAIFYCAAGAVIALPERYFASPRLGRVVLGAMGAFFSAMAVLQAWPGRGFWHGAPPSGSRRGTLTTMVQKMAETVQPKTIASLVHGFATFEAGHGAAVNLVAVIALAVLGLGLGLGSGHRAILAWVVVAAGLVCLADWVLVQDLGLFGGVGTDPNSMVPLFVLVLGGYLALTRPVAEGAEPALAEDRPTAAQRTQKRACSEPTFVLRAVAGLGAVAVVLLGAVPMAVASVSQNADPIVSQAIDGSPSSVNVPAPSFALVDQHGRVVTLASLRGKVVALTFLDPVCTAACPLIAAEYRQTDRELGALAHQVEFVAVVDNPIYHSVAATNAFDHAEALSKLDNWLFLTGPVARLKKTWGAYGMQVTVEPAGAMVAHADLVYIIDARGHTRAVLDSNPGPGTQATKASFATVLETSIEHVLGPR
ncbi:MAG: SCO family protein [Acidimicrobiales bacterium]